MKRISFEEIKKTDATPIEKSLRTKSALS
jgi:hypothetical protein